MKSLYNPDSRYKNSHTHVKAGEDIQRNEV